MTNKDVLHSALLEFIGEDELDELDEGYAIKPKDWHYTGWTSYAIAGSFLLYEAIPDLHHNTDIADERLVLTGTQFAVQNYLRTAMERPLKHNCAVHLPPGSKFPWKLHKARGGHD